MKKFKINKLKSLFLISCFNLLYNTELSGADRFFDPTPLVREIIFLELDIYNRISIYLNAIKLNNRVYKDIIETLIDVLEREIRTGNEQAVIGISQGLNHSWLQHRLVNSFTTTSYNEEEKEIFDKLLSDNTSVIKKVENSKTKTASISAPINIIDLRQLIIDINICSLFKKILTQRPIEDSCYGYITHDDLIFEIQQYKDSLKSLTSERNRSLGSCVINLAYLLRAVIGKWKDLHSHFFTSNNIDTQIINNRNIYAFEKPLLFKELYKRAIKKTNDLFIKSIFTKSFEPKLFLNQIKFSGVTGKIFNNILSQLNTIYFNVDGSIKYETPPTITTLNKIKNIIIPQWLAFLSYISINKAEFIELLTDISNAGLSDFNTRPLIDTLINNEVIHETEESYNKIVNELPGPKLDLLQPPIVLAHPFTKDFLSLINICDITAADQDVFSNSRKKALTLINKYRAINSNNYNLINDYYRNSELYSSADKPERKTSHLLTVPQSKRSKIVFNESKELTAKREELPIGLKEYDLILDLFGLSDFNIAQQTPDNFNLKVLTMPDIQLCNLILSDKSLLKNQAVKQRVFDFCKRAQFYSTEVYESRKSIVGYYLLFKQIIETNQTTPSSPKAKGASCSSWYVKKKGAESNPVYSFKTDDKDPKNNGNKKEATIEQEKEYAKKHPLNFDYNCDLKKENNEIPILERNVKANDRINNIINDLQQRISNSDKSTHPSTCFNHKDRPIVTIKHGGKNYPSNRYVIIKDNDNILFKDVENPTEKAELENYASTLTYKGLKLLANKFPAVAKLDTYKLKQIQQSGPQEFIYGYHNNKDFREHPITSKQIPRIIETASVNQVIDLCYKLRKTEYLQYHDLILKKLADFPELLFEHENKLINLLQDKSFKKCLSDETITLFNEKVSKILEKNSYAQKAKELIDSVLANNEISDLERERFLEATELIRDNDEFRARMVNKHSIDCTKVFGKEATLQSAYYTQKLNGICQLPRDEQFIVLNSLCSQIGNFTQKNSQFNQEIGNYIDFISDNLRINPEVLENPQNEFEERVIASCLNQGIIKLMPEFDRADVIKAVAKNAKLGLPIIPKYYLSNSQYEVQNLINNFIYDSAGTLLSDKPEKQEYIELLKEKLIFTSKLNNLNDYDKAGPLIYTLKYFQDIIASGKAKMDEVRKFLEPVYNFILNFKDGAFERLKNAHRIVPELFESIFDLITLIGVLHSCNISDETWMLYSLNPEYVEYRLENTKEKMSTIIDGLNKFVNGKTDDEWAHFAGQVTADILIPIYAIKALKPIFGAIKAHMLTSNYRLQAARKITAISEAVKLTGDVTKPVDVVKNFMKDRVVQFKKWCKNKGIDFNSFLDPNLPSPEARTERINTTCFMYGTGEDAANCLKDLKEITETVCNKPIQLLDKHKNKIPGFENIIFDAPDHTILLDLELKNKIGISGFHCNPANIVKNNELLKINSVNDLGYGIFDAIIDVNGKTATKTIMSSWSRKQFFQKIMESLSNVETIRSRNPGFEIIGRTKEGIYISTIIQDTIIDNLPVKLVKTSYINSKKMRFQ